MLLSAETLLFYQRCPRRAFLDVYGDVRHKEPESDFLRKLRQDSRLHREEILASFTYHQPSYPRYNWLAGSQSTLELMQQGVECIYRGVLLTQWSGGTTLLSVPDLLVKQPGESDFGNWRYEAHNIKLGKRSKIEYQIVGAFDAQVLANVQGAWPDTTWLLLRKRSPHPVNLAQRVGEMHQILNECIVTLRDRRAPEVFISRQRCGLCHWYTSCHAVAEKQRHLSLLPGITPNRYEQLQKIEVTGLEDLADLGVTQLVPLMGEDIAQQLVWQAVATLENRAIWKSNRVSSLFIPSPVTSRLKLNRQDSDAPIPPYLKANVELHFDLEAEPELDIDFLFGVLVIDRLKGTEKFYPLIAEKPEDEEKVWMQFLEVVGMYPDAPIFHFCDYEVKTTSKLAKRYNTPDFLWKPLLDRFVDVHLWMTQTVVLPVESYALKAMARWIGFEWRDASANGAQCICWYNKWLETGDRRYLETILQYNEDDCRATYRVKEWLVEFWQQQLQPHSTQ
ncbi:TM0106 family RecB-like putative nuclease [Oscillatoriales cyanobacterium LEGE 11467]|uniref:TM0106 family RecB-like putative nuclease n=1 Tax=Zarconia navalis LEGE 11467 TaxID=1828826 RepID=A0A928Z7Z4_9CYAN|nr:TM0106 family RecB-like putative nuclease [Zarconia navalis]MBE9041050.1 TM0106 family RecB-like putative nuclease [Zarconia navalis LEGE 11467]